MNLEHVRRTALEVAREVELAMRADEVVLLLGGDCTVELGTVAGAMRAAERVGLVYIDFDADLTTPERSDGALDWTGVAHLLDIPGAEPELSAIGAKRPLLRPGQVVYFGVQNITEDEARVIAAHSIERVSVEEIRVDAAAAGERCARALADCDCLLVHLDVDVLTYVDFPIAENVRRCQGLSFEELRRALPALLAAPNFRALTVTEVNPDHAPDPKQAFERLIALLVEAFRQRRG